MKMPECEWLPPLEEHDPSQAWPEYEDFLYEIFKNDFILHKPYFMKKRVSIRRFPIENGKEESFYHVTCQDYNHTRERFPDLKRCERIRWVKSFIEKHHCNLETCEDCESLKVWSKKNKKGRYSRVHILFEEERYMVVLEPREEYCLLITAFYFDQEHKLRKKIKEYNSLNNN